MKKILSVILSIAVMTAFVYSITVTANDDIAVEIDGAAIDFDVKPEIVDGRTMVPLRKIFEEIGAIVKWNGDTKTVSARKSSKTVTLTIDSADLQLEKGTDEEGNPITENITLEVPAQIVNGRTLVPVRAISESFGLLVEWDEDNKKVIITSDDEEDDSWKENVGSVNLTDLTFEGNGIEIKDNQIVITSGGDYTLTGTLADGNVTVSTKEKVNLRLSDASITSSENPCIFIEDADKVYIILTDGTENFLIAENSEDGAVYSKENLEIKGKGVINIESPAGHAIKASDNLTIENGTINLTSSNDGMHINETFKMNGGNVNITATGDGIDSESIVIIEDGIINVETNGTPIENVQVETDATQQFPRKGMWGETADVEFEKSTKGINAEWMLLVSGGEINVNSASHAIHCQDEIEIKGGNFTLNSEYDKGISAHGNLTVSNSNTVIDITKSTEGIESKNVLTIHDGIINVIATDDALNATGGNTGMGMGPWGGMVPPENIAGANDAEIPDMPIGNRGGRNKRFHQMQNGEMPEEGVFPTRGEMPPMPENGDFWFPGERPAEPFGEMPPRPPMGGMGRNMKECLIINGGQFELCGKDDCIDANGNMVINNAIIKAVNPTGSFYGNFGVLDSDGQITINENAKIILASGGGSERNLPLVQNNIIIYCDSEHIAEDEISVKNSNGDIIYSYTPAGNYKGVLIASNDFEIGNTYTVTVGSELHIVTLEKQSTIIGAPKTGEWGRNRFLQ